MEPEEKLRILVVDDDPDTAASIKTFLKASLAAEVETVGDCASAMEKLSSSTLDLVFLDYRPPDGDGLSLLEEIVKMDGAPPVIMVTDRRTKIDWAYSMRELVDEHFPGAKRITVVMDNLNTHCPSSLYEAFAPEEARRILRRLELHHTPKHGSWLNMAEIELSILGRQCISRRIPDQQTLRHEVSA